MKVRVYFETNTGLSYVGMNNLLIIDDGRIKTIKGIHKRIEQLVRNYHKYKQDKQYHILKWEEDYILDIGVVNTIEE